MIKVRKIDRKYRNLAKGIDPKATYRHLGIAFIFCSIPIIGNLASLFLGIHALIYGRNK